MIYHFYIEDAIRVGVDRAVLLYFLCYWVTHNKANERNYYDGYYWTYNSCRALEKIFPFWSTQKIGRLLNDLERKNIIKSGSFNKSPYDKTKWYTVVDSSLIKRCNYDWSNAKDRYFKSEESTGSKCKIEQEVLKNPNHNNDKPIPINKTNKNTNKTTKNACLNDSEKKFEDELRDRGWSGDIGKFLSEPNVGGLESAWYHWDTHVRQMVDNSNGFWNGGKITNELRKSAAIFKNHLDKNVLELQDQKDLEAHRKQDILASKYHDSLVESGRKIFSNQSKSQRDKCVEKFFIAHSDMREFYLNDYKSGHFSNDVLEQNVYLMIAETNINDLENHRNEWINSKMREDQSDVS